MVSDAVWLGVKFTEQAPPLRVQVVVLKLPSPVGDTEKVMVPVGVSVAPPRSDTVAVQVDGEFNPSGLGEQTTAVFVLIVVTVRVNPEDGPLPEWSVSPA
jgi:hypothetical protein